MAHLQQRLLNSLLLIMFLMPLFPLQSSFAQVAYQMIQGEGLDTVLVDIAQSGIKRGDFQPSLTVPHELLGDYAESSAKNVKFTQQQRRKLVGPCMDLRSDCSQYAEGGAARQCKDDSYIQKLCPETCNICNPHMTLVSGVEQRVPIYSDLDGTDNDIHTITADSDVLRTRSRNVQKQYRVREIIERSEHYVREFYSETCKNRHEDCAIWTVEGACELRPDEMRQKCGPACQNCHLNDPSKQTPFLRKDMAGIFQKIELLDLVGSDYDAHVYEQDGYFITVLDDFLSKEDCLKYIEYIQSHDHFRGGGGSNVITIADEDTQLADWTERLYAKVSEITGAPRTNIERISLEKHNATSETLADTYEWIPNELLKGGGSRVLIIYIFLNSVPEDFGGELEFANMNEEITPIQGRAILIPCVKSLYYRYESDGDTYSSLEEEVKASFRHTPLSKPSASDPLVVESATETSKYGMFVYVREFPYSQ